MITDCDDGVYYGRPVYEIKTLKYLDFETSLWKKIKTQGLVDWSLICDIFGKTKRCAHRSHRRPYEIFKGSNRKGRLDTTLGVGNTDSSVADSFFGPRLHLI